MPDANTLWDFREELVSAGVFERLFEQFAQQPQAKGLLAQGGKLVGTSFVDMPQQRNPRAESKRKRSVNSCYKQLFLVFSFWPETIYAGGYFTNAGEVRASGLACWNRSSWAEVGAEQT